MLRKWLLSLLLPLALAGWVLLWVAKLLVWPLDHAASLTYGAFFESLANRIYFIGQPNTGLAYYVGFVIGLCQNGSGGAVASKRRKS